MRPLTEALDILQADKKVSIGYLLPTLTILMNKMESLRRKTGIVHCKAFISSIITALNCRFAHCFNDEDLCLAAMVHPKFKLSWIKEGERTDMLEKLNLSFETFSTDSNPSSCRRVVSEDSDASPNKKKNFFESLYRSSSIPSTSELDMFLADQSTKTNSLLKFPTIKEMFLKFNAALPSSASVERLFSVGGSIFRPTRNRLSDANFEKMLFLKVNSKL
ncbi:uncharacterized protein LOC124197389 [Daphnia pulex]|uniref:uncharacterized protein LOC124197389 n=1 Tax=Daphnia pulex TaxID=6669 RepID=UPI001EDE8261|nr:uncharacterized protein LOC124197389 [Daphnia pulex]